jgi:DNA-directed RNA polymerase sigma subunit (sigma70/sigma32)
MPKKKLTSAQYNEITKKLFKKRFTTLSIIASISSSTRPRHSKLVKCKRDLEKITTEIVNLNYGLVKSYVSRFSPYTSFENAKDFESAGLLGLLRAIDTFDPDKGTFSQWAYLPIKREILRCVHLIEFPTISAKDFEVRPSIILARDLILAKNKEIPMLPRTLYAEIAKKIGITSYQVQRVLEASSKPAGLFYTDETGYALEITNYDYAANSESSTDALLSSLLISKLVKDGIPSLTKREQEIITYRFGLGTTGATKLEQISRKLGLSREATRQIEYKAIAKLSHPVVLRILLENLV